MIEFFYSEEWEYLKRLHLPDVTDNATEQQRTFLELLTSAAKRLFNYMEVSNEEALIHRLYDSEVIDLTEDVSFIVLCPSAEMSCSVPGQREMLLQRGDLLSLPIQVFEMIHLNTYQSNIIQKYSKLSCLLELDAATANHLHREAFSNTEVAVAKERLTKLQDLQSKLNSIWRGVRWLMDVITFARDRSSNGVSMRYVFDKEVTTTTMSPKRTLLQIPPRDTKIVKTSPGRGSWPGPGATNGGNSGLMNEFSKSEQHLSTNDGLSQYLSACSDTESRKNSDSYGSDCFTDRLPPSRSEDVLFAIPTTNTNNKTQPASSISATSSPLLSVRPIYSGSLVSVNTLNTTNTSDSMHSLSSDSDASCPIPVGASTPSKTRQKTKITPSRSMTNVKQHTLNVTTTTNKHLTIEPRLPITNNLENTFSKSLTNLKTFPIEMETYLKPKEPIKKPPDLVVDPIFKVPLTDTAGTSSSVTKEQNGIIQVYAAYETGLASGTSLKLHVTPRTTAREVVDLVVKQLNMAVVLKGKEGPIYPAEKLKNFCLVAVIGARERCLRDDFKPLQLQNPWKKGRLYVRQKHDVLAALEHSSKHSAII